MVRPHLSFMVRASIILEMAAFSTYFFDEMNIFQAHFFIDSLAHVVNREQGRRHAGQGLHSVSYTHLTLPTKLEV